MNKRVVVGLSGGVDSAVAALLLKKQGFDVIGVFALGWGGNKDFPCSWQQDEADARAVAVHLGIKFTTVNLSDEYEQAVINRFLDGYRQGETPNPDVLCNSEIKFKAMWQALRQFEPDYIATGHYARIVKQNDQTFIARSKDSNKDQTYFLWNISPRILPKILFPLQDLTKPDVRQIAKDIQLPNATKKDSQGVCFVGPLKVRAFLASQLQPKAGDVLDLSGQVIAQHQGAALYTIGERLGAGSVKWTGDIPPLFVVKKDVVKNTLTVGSDADTYSQRAFAHSANWFKQPASGSEVETMIRYRQPAVPATVTFQDEGIQIDFKKPVRAVTSGQSIVFYNSDGILLGGAVLR